MRKLVLLVLVLGMASVASAEVLTLRVVDLGASGGRDGTVGNELQASDVVGLEIYLETINVNAQYGGYWVDGLDISVDVESGPGALDINFSGINDGAAIPGRLYGNWISAGVVDNPQKIALSGENTYNGWTPWADQVDDGAYRLFWGMLFHCEGPGAVEVDINLNGPHVPGVYSYAGIGSRNYASTESNWWIYPGPSWYWSQNPGLFQLQDADLGSIVINQIPEPITLGLLALGGVALIRKRLF